MVTPYNRLSKRIRQLYAFAATEWPSVTLLSEKDKVEQSVQHAVLSLAAQSCLTLYPGPSVRGDPPGKNTGVGLPCLPPGDLHNLGIEPRSPTLQVYSLSSEPPGKPMNTGVGSLTLLQGIFPTQEMNRGLLHCRQILYQLSYQGSPV